MNQPGAKAFIIYNHKLLLVLRDNNPNIPYPNTWNTPGGGIEKDETPEQALKRELLEEIDLIPSKMHYLGKMIKSDGSWATRHVIFLSDEEYKNLKLLEEGQEMRLFTIPELLKEKLSGQNTEYFRKYQIPFERLLNQGIIPLAQEIGLER